MPVCSMFHCVTIPIYAKRGAKVANPCVTKLANHKYVERCLQLQVGGGDDRIACYSALSIRKEVTSLSSTRLLVEMQLAKLTPVTRMNALLGLLVAVITLHYGVTTFTSKLKLATINITCCV